MRGDFYGKHEKIRNVLSDRRGGLRIDRDDVARTHSLVDDNCRWNMLRDILGDRRAYARTVAHIQGGDRCGGSDGGGACVRGDIQYCA